MDTIQELQNFRTHLIQEINITFDRMIQNLRTEQTSSESVNENREYETLYPLTVGSGIFKGKKPTGIKFPDGTRIDVPTWKKVVEVILQRCNEDPVNHSKLMALRGKLAGRDRIFLGKERGNMRSPVKIDKYLYLETHYDTETLLRILTTRILDAVQYDYSGISIAIRND